MTMNFLQALQGVGTELFAITPKLFLPRTEVLSRLAGKVALDTPYLRRRMRGRLRGHCE